MKRRYPTRTFHLVAICLGLLPLVLASSAMAVCKSDSAIWGFRNDLNKDMNDYALFFQDVSDCSCVTTAAEALLAKIEATLGSNHTDALGRSTGPYQGWLEGAHVSLIFATALQLGGQGLLTSELDEALAEVIDSYTHNPIKYGLDPSCGFDGGDWQYGNTCMDDYAVAASAYGWMARYYQQRGIYFAHLTREAKTAVQKALSPTDSVCIYDAGSSVVVSGRGVCNGSVAGLAAGTAETVSLNHGTQNIAYGFGLLTSIASTFASGHHPTLSSDEKKIALELFEEAQRKTTSTGSAFKTNCYRFAVVGSMVVIYNDADCGDASLHYKPKMFALKSFYTRYIGTPATTVVDLGVTQTAYQFSSFSSSLFTSNPNDFFGPGRRVIYGDLGYYWHKNGPPPLDAVFDEFNPIGYLDAIDTNGCAIGWTCDQDAASKSIDVHFYVDGFGQFIGSATANFTSESAINSLCGGGTKHRFYYCLPAWTQGRLIYAYGIDYSANLNSCSGNGFTNVPGWQCPQSPACTW